MVQNQAAGRRPQSRAQAAPGCWAPPMIWGAGALSPPDLAARLRPAGWFPRAIIYFLCPRLEQCKPGRGAGLSISENEALSSARFGPGACVTLSLQDAEGAPGGSNCGNGKEVLEVEGNS